MFSPLAKLCSILSVLKVSMLLRRLCIRNAFTVLIGQSGGRSSSTCSVCVCVCVCVCVEVYLYLGCIKVGPVCIKQLKGWPNESAV